MSRLSGLDYVGIGSVHATASKPDAAAALGVDGFAALAGSTFLPAVAIGGVTRRPTSGACERAARPGWR